MTTSTTFFVSEDDLAQAANALGIAAMQMTDDQGNKLRIPVDQTTVPDFVLAALRRMTGHDVKVRS